MSESQEVILIMGYPASGKSRLSQEYVQKGYKALERDKEGGKIIDLVPKVEAALNRGESVVLANLFPTIEVRNPFIEIAKKLKVPIHCLWMGTSLEDSQINALHRMWQKYQRLFYSPEDLKGVRDNNIFPILLFFKYRNELEKPKKEEGFDSIRKIPFVREKSPNYNQKAFIFDYDQTLRTTINGEYKFPTAIEEIELLPRRKEKLDQLKAKGYLFLGVSNQSGIAKKQLSEAQAIACFEQTNQMLSHKIHFVYCPHSVPPKCYCRKPQSGLGVFLIETYKLDPAQCTYIGDQTTDKTFAKRLGFNYILAQDFF